jgi:hypothetical protein
LKDFWCGFVMGMGARTFLRLAAHRKKAAGLATAATRSERDCILLAVAFAPVQRF